MFNIWEIPQISNIHFWRSTGGQTTSERGADSAEPHFRAITDQHGRILVAMTHNTDIQDAWERIEATAHNHEGSEYLINQFVGQVVGQMNSVRSCRAVIEDMVQEYVDTQERLNQWAEVD